MKKFSYAVILQSQLGPRAGELVLQEESGVVSGYFNLVGHRSGFSGSMVGDGKYFITGTLRAAAGKEPYDGLLTVHSGRLTGGIITDCGWWDLSGVPTGAPAEPEK